MISSSESSPSISKSSYNACAYPPGYCEISRPSECICKVYIAKSRSGSFATASNLELLSIMRRPLQQGQHISSLNCCSLPYYLGPLHSTMLSTSWLFFPSIFIKSLVYSIKKQLSREKGIHCDGPAFCFGISDRAAWVTKGIVGELVCLIEEA